MLKLALEIPTSMLDRWAPLCDFDFILAHKVLEDPHYARFFAARSDGREVLLDNSTHEFGHPLSWNELENAADRCRADYLVVPDVIPSNTGLTREQYEQNLKWLDEAQDAIVGTRFATVLCGTNVTEVHSYITEASEISDMMCFTFHNPRRLEWWDLFTSHPHFAQWSRVHALGVSTLEELREWVRLSETFLHIEFSVDTCKPIAFGLQEKRLRDVPSSQSLRGNGINSKMVLDYPKDKITPTQMECVEENIAFLRSVCRGEA